MGGKGDRCLKGVVGVYRGGWNMEKPGQGMRCFIDFCSFK